EGLFRIAAKRIGQARENVGLDDFGWGGEHACFPRTGRIVTISRGGKSSSANANPLYRARPRKNGVEQEGRMLKIWGRSSSSNVAKVCWACGEMGLAFERYDVGGDFGGNDTPEYLAMRSEEHTSELQSRENLVCRLLLEK